MSLVVHLSALSGFSWAAERQIRGGRLGLGGPHSPDVVEDQLLGGRLNTCGPMDVPVVHRVVEQQLLVLYNPMHYRSVHGSTGIQTSP